VTLGVPTEVSAYLVDDGGMVNLYEVDYLTPKDMDQIIIYIMRPGGTMDVVLPEVPQVGVSGDAEFELALPGHIHQIPNSGHPVILRSVMNIKLLVCWLNHQCHIMRGLDINVSMVPTLRVWRNHMTFKGEHRVTTTQLVINDKDWPKTSDYLSEYLVAILGKKGNEFSYVTHPQVDVSPEVGDPYMGYGTVDLEMIARGSHTGSAYQMDNRNVWEIMHSIFSEHVRYICIKCAARMKNSRYTYQNLFGHYLGRNNANSMASAAESKMNAMQYSGEKQNFNFERCVRIRTEKHSVLNGLVEHWYSVIDESSKLRIILKVITMPQYDIVLS
jgi:hypothetical protein